VKNKRYIIIGLTAVIISILVFQSVYTIIDKRHPKETETQREYLGDIEIPAKKWLNGHFGVFFRFKQLGNINWLLIPLLIWFLVGRRTKKPEQWQMALIFIWLLTVVFIGIKGYDNVRYQLTLFPFTSAMVLFLLWQLLEDKNKFVKILCFSLVALACLFNIYHYIDTYKFYWDLRVSVKNPHFPYQLVNFLESNQDVNNSSKVLTINQPLFYYHIPKKGVDYVSSHAIKVWVEFKKKVGTVRSRNKLYRLLRKRLKVKYILLGSLHKRFNRSTILEEFLHCECKPVLEDQGRLLYRLRDSPLEKQLKSPAYREIKVWNESQSTVRTISPSLLRFYRKGIFKFEVGKGKKNNTIIVRNIRVKKGAKRRIHFGLEFNRKGLHVDAREYEGKYVHFVVRTAISPHLLNRDNYICIADYNKNGTHEARKTYFTSHHWRTYIVSKKVNPDNSRLVLTFRFCPQSADQQLAIKDIKIVVSKEPL
jgi:hypothetical protein